jgi:hypothetical protein
LYWYKNRKEDQWIRIEDPDIKPCICGQLIFNKDGEYTHTMGKRHLFSKCCRENCISTCRRLKQDPCLSPCTKINSKWIKDLNINLKLETTPQSSRKYTKTDRYRE